MKTKKDLIKENRELKICLSLFMLCYLIIVVVYLYNFTLDNSKESNYIRIDDFKNVSEFCISFRYMEDTITRCSEGSFFVNTELCNLDEILSKWDKGDFIFNETLSEKEVKCLSYYSFDKDLTGLYRSSEK